MWSNLCVVWCCQSALRCQAWIGRIHALPGQSMDCLCIVWIRIVQSVDERYPWMAQLNTQGHHGSSMLPLYWVPKVSEDEAASNQENPTSQLHVDTSTYILQVFAREVQRSSKYLCEKYLLCVNKYYGEHSASWQVEEMVSGSYSPSNATDVLASFSGQSSIALVLRIPKLWRKQQQRAHSHNASSMLLVNINTRNVNCLCRNQARHLPYEEVWVELGFFVVCSGHHRDWQTSEQLILEDTHSKR